MIIVKTSAAGTLESSDAYVTVAPAGGLEIEIGSVVMAQYGPAIRACVDRTLKELNVTSGKITIQDKGAVDCVIAARVETACRRGGGEKA